MSGLRASQNTEKFAFIHNQAYSNCDFGGVDLPPTGHLKTFDTSHSAGENRAKSGLTGLTASLGAAFFVVTTALTPSTALADDAPRIVPSATVVAATSGVDACVHVQGYSDKSCASTGFENPMTADEITSDMRLNRDRVILHFGDGIIDADLAAKDLDDSGTPALAIPGGPENGIRLILSGKEIKSRTFTQANLNRGEVTGPATILLKRVQEHQAAQRTTVQQAAFVPNN